MYRTILLDWDGGWLRCALPMQSRATLKTFPFRQLVSPILHMILNSAFRSTGISLARTPVILNRRFMIIDHRIWVNNRILVDKLALLARPLEFIELRIASTCHLNCELVYELRIRPSSDCRTINWWFFAHVKRRVVHVGCQMIAAHRNHVSCVVNHSLCEKFRLLPRIFGLLRPEDWYLNLLKKEDLHAFQLIVVRVYHINQRDVYHVLLAVLPVVIGFHALCEILLLDWVRGVLFWILNALLVTIDLVLIIVLWISFSALVILVVPARLVLVERLAVLQAIIIIFLVIKGFNLDLWRRRSLLFEV